MANTLSGSPFPLVIRVLSALSLTALVGCESIGMSDRLTEHYDEYLTLPHYRAFSATPGGPDDSASVGYSHSSLSVDHAIEGSLEACEREGPSSFVLDRCRLHSIGDINVSAMTKGQIDRAIRDYRSNVSATDNGVQGGVKKQTRTVEPVIRSASITAFTQ